MHGSTTTTWRSPVGLVREEIVMGKRGRKIIDLKGQVFGEMTVIEYVGQSKKKAAMWLCRCSCGNEKVTLSSSLRKGSVTSCGCRRREVFRRHSFSGQPKHKDMVGQVFGKLTVTSRADPPRDRFLQAMWRCRCECGNNIDVRGSHLRKENGQKSCSKCRPYAGKLLPYKVGQVIGNLTILELAPGYYKTREGSHRGWRCQCKCGKIIVVTSSNLKSQKSCLDCSRKEGGKKQILPLTGRKFGRLLVIGPTEVRYHGYVVWKCRCDCGEVKYLPTHSLVTGNTKSCGCILGEGNGAV
jgi:hypothetical protein